jgi:hypothetical protein
MKGEKLLQRGFWKQLGFFLRVCSQGLFCADACGYSTTSGGKIAAAASGATNINGIVVVLRFII